MQTCEDPRITQFRQQLEANVHNLPQAHWRWNQDYDHSTGALVGDNGSEWTEVHRHPMTRSHPTPENWRGTYVSPNGRCAPPISAHERTYYASNPIPPRRMDEFLGDGMGYASPVIQVDDRPANWEEFCSRLSPQRLAAAGVAIGVAAASGVVSGIHRFCRVFCEAATAPNWERGDPHSPYHPHSWKGYTMGDYKYDVVVYRRPQRSVFEKIMPCLHDSNH